MVTTTDLAAIADRDLVVEAIVEKLEVKAAVLQRLDGICRADAVLASNTSTISLTQLAAQTARPERVIGMHFFDPVPVMQLVEIIRALQTSDALALLDHLRVARAAIVGSSRDGLLAMVMVALAPGRVAGVCFNDVGPVLEKAGLLRIGTYMGITPEARTLAEAADRTPAANPGFRGVPALRWEEETVRHYVQTADGLGLPYDPALRLGFDRAMAGPLPPAWELFDGLAGLPLALIRGENSDVLTQATADAMQAHRPDLIRAEVLGRGHIPFLDEPEALAVIHRRLPLCRCDERA